MTEVSTSKSTLVPEPLSINEERVVSLRHAIRLVKEAKYVAFCSKVNDHNHVIVDVSKACALRNLRRQRGRLKQVRVADIFGTTVVGN